MRNQTAQVGVMTVDCTAMLTKPDIKIRFLAVLTLSLEKRERFDGYGREISSKADSTEDRIKEEITLSK